MNDETEHERWRNEGTGVFRKNKKRERNKVNSLPDAFCLILDVFGFRFFVFSLFFFSKVIFLKTRKNRVNPASATSSSWSSLFTFSFLCVETFSSQFEIGFFVSFFLQQKPAYEMEAEEETSDLDMSSDDSDVSRIVAFPARHRDSPQQSSSSSASSAFSPLPRRPFTLHPPRVHLRLLHLCLLLLQHLPGESEGVESY